MITVSQILFSALSVYAGVDPAKVQGHPQRCLRAVLPADRRGRPERGRAYRYSLPEHFAFWAGDFRPEKNVLFLIQAWSRLQKRLSDPPALVLAGAQKIQYRQAAGKRSRSADLEGKILFPGFIGDDDLPAVYSRRALRLSVAG